MHDRRDRSDSRSKIQMNVHVCDCQERFSCKNGRSRHGPIDLHVRDRHERSNCRLKHHVDVRVCDRQERFNCKNGRSRHDLMYIHGRDCHDKSTSMKCISRNHMDV